MVDVQKIQLEKTLTYVIRYTKYRYPVLAKMFFKKKQRIKLNYSERWKIWVEVPSSGILSLSSQRGRCRTTLLQDYRVQEYRLPSPPSIKCNVPCVRVSLGTIQNIPCATLKRRGSWVIAIYLSNYFKHLDYLRDVDERTVHCLVHFTAPESAVHVNPLIISSQNKNYWKMEFSVRSSSNRKCNVACQML